MRAAESGVSQAQQELNAAGAGPTKVDSFQADVKVAAAEQALAAAKAEGGNVQQAEWDVQTARLERDQLWAAKDTGAERAAVDAAKAQVASANTALEEARRSTLPYLPSSEVLYLTELPRRVDAVTVERGTILSGAAMTVSGATVRLTGAAAEADARLLQVGAEAVFDLPDGADRKSTRLNSSHSDRSRMPSSA